jgi:hypothetical protein
VAVGPCLLEYESASERAWFQWRRRRALRACRACGERRAIQRSAIRFNTVGLLVGELTRAMVACRLRPTNGTSVSRSTPEQRRAREIRCRIARTRGRQRGRTTPAGTRLGADCGCRAGVSADRRDLERCRRVGGIGRAGRRDCSRLPRSDRRLLDWWLPRVGCLCCRCCGRRISGRAVDRGSDYRGMLGLQLR